MDLINSTLPKRIIQNRPWPWRRCSRRCRCRCRWCWGWRAPSAGRWTRISSRAAWGRDNHQGPERHHSLKVAGSSTSSLVPLLSEASEFGTPTYQVQNTTNILSIWVVTYIMGIKMMECGIWNICHLHRSEERYDAILDFSTKSLSDPHNQTSRQWSWRYCQWAQVPQPLAKQLLPAKKLPMEPRSLLDKHSWGWPLM